MEIKNPAKLLEQLCSEPRETEWLEFKHDRFEPDQYGEYVSALANSAILHNQRHAYLVFGIEDKTHEIVGTNLRIKNRKVGNEEFENWLVRHLDPRINIQFIDFLYRGKHIEMAIIDPAFIRPVEFKQTAYIRIGSIKKPLREYPEKQRALWIATSRYSFEQGIAAHHLSKDEVLHNFYCEKIFELLGRAIPNSDGIIDYLLMEELILDDRQGGYDVTNLLALAGAKDLRKYPSVASKSPRLLVYKSKNKFEAVIDQIGQRGYAVAFSQLLTHIMTLLPHKEELRHGLRHTEHMFPEIAIREILANALIHQDLTITGARPTIEIYKDRIEIVNLGIPLVPVERFIDAPAKSRNEKLADLMRRLNICEERGSGIDRAIDAIESRALPAPLIEVVAESTVLTIFAERKFSGMNKEDRIRAAYQHACLRYEVSDPMSNSSLRKRFGLHDRQYSQVSAVIREAQDSGLIRPLDQEQANRNARYVPFWAGTSD